MNYFGAIHFLCGPHTACNDSHSGLQLAKKHIEEDYLLVGLTERLPDFMETLEVLLPGLFHNINTTFRQIQARVHRTSRTRIKQLVDTKLTALLRQQLAPEMELYGFAMQKFNKLWKAILSVKQRDIMNE
jgi:hypothetical protein